MSVLSVPRIYFKGSISWDPNTCNNNDQWPTYDFTNADLNWGFLATQKPAITPQNFRSLFPDWAQTLQVYRPPSGDPWLQPPAEWNYYGGNSVLFSSDLLANSVAVTGGQSEYGGKAVGDQLVNAPVQIQGDGSSPRMVDINPDAFWSTDFYLASFQAGSDAASGPYLFGDVAEAFGSKKRARMSSRFFSVTRNLNLNGELEIAGPAGTVLQICLSKSNPKFKIVPGGSALLEQLQKQMAAPDVLGVMVRMSVYTTRYFNRKEFEGCTTLTEQYTRLTELWREALKKGEQPIQNPALSCVVGTIGLWQQNSQGVAELTTVPGGRYLLPDQAVAVLNAPSGTATPLGIAVAEFKAQASSGQSYLVLDMGSTIPEIDSQGTKADVGDLQLCLSGAAKTTIATLEPSQYDQAAYEATAGILDLPLPSTVSPEDLAKGHLILQSSSGVRALGESASKLVVQTDQRGIYVDQGGTGSLTLQVTRNGLPPAEEVKILLQQYLPDPPPPTANAGAWIQPSPFQPPAIEFLDAPRNTISIDPSSKGLAQVRFQPLRPGFPTLVFFPYTQNAPQPPPVIPPAGAPLIMESAFYSCARNLPYDDGLPGDFAALYNSTPDAMKEEAAWDFIYYRIFFLYDMLYPVMQYYAHIDLGSRQDVNRNHSAIASLISRDMLDNTFYMPVTRELSAGKRLVLEMYMKLAGQNFPPAPISVPGE